MQKIYKFLFTMLATLCFAICCSGCSENYNNQNTIKIKNKSLDELPLPFGAVAPMKVVSNSRDSYPFLTGNPAVRTD